jgi:hypothetical protein
MFAKWGTLTTAGMTIEFGPFTGHYLSIAMFRVGDFKHQFAKLGMGHLS